MLVLVPTPVFMSLNELSHLGETRSSILRDDILLDMSDRVANKARLVPLVKEKGSRMKSLRVQQLPYYLDLDFIKPSSLWTSTF
jgi:hypothetical protein